MIDRIRFCHNKKCEAYNSAQGDYGYEDDVTFPCIFCGKELSKKNNKVK